MKDYDLKSIKSAALVKGYFLDKELPEPVRAAVNHLCDEIDAIISDVNQIVEADLAREEMERAKKRAERAEKKSESPVIEEISRAHEALVEPAAQDEPPKAKRKPKGVTPKISDDDLPIIKQKVDAGMTFTSIGRQHKCTGQTVVNFLRRHDIDPSKRRKETPPGEA